MNSGFKKLDAYKIAYPLAMEIFTISRNFPKEETYSLTDQIRRCSRSVCSNFAEAYRKRKYKSYFISKLTDCDAECSETLVWLDFSRDCNYISASQHDSLSKKCIEIGKLLGYMILNPEKYMQ
jgi:four helix bundle protein